MTPADHQRLILIGTHLADHDAISRELARRARARQPAPESSAAVTIGKKGRPRIDRTDSTVGVAVRLPLREYDRLARAAIRSSVSIPELIRRAPRRKRDDDHTLAGLTHHYRVDLPGAGLPDGVPIKLGVTSDGLPNPTLYERTGK